MGDFPASTIFPPGGVISTGSLSSSFGPVAAMTNALSAVTGAWPTANLAIYISFTLEVPVIAYQMSVENGATLNGNLDVGIYDINGNRLVSSGSTAQTGTSTIQALNITDTALSPGIYYLAMATNSTTATYRSNTAGPRFSRPQGIRQQATAFALPATATFAVMTVAYTPWVAIHFNATV